MSRDGRWPDCVWDAIVAELSRGLRPRVLSADELGAVELCWPRDPRVAVYVLIGHIVAWRDVLEGCDE